MNLYKLHPTATGDLFIAPNATIVGEVYMGSKISIGHGTVIRGDINSV
jgi:carbonic anhydrase/acetyltransferase-like protein (isoleucine patch superfamily)